jgi:hypothetical protein
MTNAAKTGSWLCASLAAVIMLQTLYFKFSAAPESVYIFSTLGLEPYGRIGTGIAELIAATLLLIPKTRIYGAGFGIGIMIGAIIGHLTKLGIEIADDGGYLFILCIVVLVTSAICLLLERKKILVLFQHIYASRQKHD